MRLTIGNIDYKIIKTLYRTKGSYNQILAEHISGERIERRRKFYIVELEGIKYFVKEYADKNYGGKLGFPKNIEYEYNTTKRLWGNIRTMDGIIGVPKTIALSDNKIIFEYLEGFRKVSPSQLLKVQRIVREWLVKKDVDNYDLCPNNIMVRDGKKMEVRLIDFEKSEDRHPKQEWNI